MLSSFSGRPVGFLVAVAVLIPSLAAAQPPRTQPGTTRPAPPAPAAADAGAGESRGFVSFGGGIQASSNDFSETHTQPLNLENETWTATYSSKTGLELEAGAGWRVFSHLFVAGAYSHVHDA